MNDLAKKLELALKEIERLNQENQLLKQKLAELTKDETEVNNFSPPKEYCMSEPFAKST